MATALGGIDAIAFTGGIGEHAAPVRESIVDQLRFLGDFDVCVVAAREDVVAARAARVVTARLRKFPAAIQYTNPTSS